MKKIYYISDYFAEDVGGGAEKADDVIIKYLSSFYDLTKIRSSQFSGQNCFEGDILFIISNFTNLSKESKQYIEKQRYFIIEHDHKYIKLRNPTHYQDNKVPAGEIINSAFYRNAEFIFCQSNAHAECVRDNLLLDNVCSFGMSFWSDDELDIISKNIKKEKEPKAIVLSHANNLKGTRSSIEFCRNNNLDMVVLSGRQAFSEFIESLSCCDSFVYLPKLMESFCRVVAEARMLGLKIYANKNVTCISEEWFSKHKNANLISFVKEKSNENLKSIKNTIEMGSSDLLIEGYEYPKISLITSMFKGEKYIEKFLNNITSQTVFDKCELIIIDAKSPENEFPIIEKYMKQYSNIKYKRLENDPGIYGAWNVGIRMASGKYLTNANLDDIKSREQIEIMVNCLEKNPKIDLAYSESYITALDNEAYEKNSSEGKTYPIADFSDEAMVKCLPGCMPVWRKSMHEKVGYFDESFRHAGDHEMWLRSVRAGSKFKRISGTHGLYYMNSAGLSTSKETAINCYKEEQQVFWEYADVFGLTVTNQYRDYFSRVWR